MYKFLSEVENLSVEWENESGHRWWETFENEIEMSKTLQANQDYNNQPEIKAMIEADLQAQKLWMVEMELNQYLDWAREDNRTLDILDVKQPYWKKPEIDHALNILSKHNKRVLATRRAKPATFKLGELMKNLNLNLQ